MMNWSLFLYILLIGANTLATHLEMDIYNSTGPLPLNSSLMAISPQLQSQNNYDTPALSSLVRIESLQKKSEKNSLNRLGTGVIIGRYKDNNDHSFLHFKEGIIVLTANHVLVGLKNEEDTLTSRLSLFDSKRHYYSTYPYKILSTQLSEDLALLDVALPWEQSLAINLPKLGLLDPNSFTNFQWIPKYYRVNPGPIDNTELTFSEISPKDSVSMMTQDGINSLAIFTKYFWYIPNEFVPGMSGGPIFTANVRSSGMSEDKDKNYNNLLVGVMGYIFNRNAQFGYAYPLTKDSLINLFKTPHESSTPLELNLHKMSLISSVFQLGFEHTADSGEIKVYKKRSPENNVADEISLKVWGHSIQDSNLFSLEFIQRFNFDPILDINTKSNKGTPTTDTGGPGGGGSTEGTPGAGSPIIINGFKQTTFIEIIINHIQFQGEKSFSLERIEKNSQSTTIDFLKDLINISRAESNINLFINPLKFNPQMEKTYVGFLDLNLLKENYPPLNQLGYIILNVNKFIGKHLMRSNGLTINLTGSIRDTKTGQSQPLSLSLGFIRNNKTGQINAAPIAKFTVNNQEMIFPPNVHYKIENEILKAEYNNQILFEVHL